MVEIETIVKLDWQLSDTLLTFHYGIIETYNVMRVQQHSHQALRVL
jgi:hypothetical protein